LQVTAATVAMEGTVGMVAMAAEATGKRPEGDAGSPKLGPCVRSQESG
jgi:hypothetical protein